jgi:hypothetical protein
MQILWLVSRRGAMAGKSSRANIAPIPFQGKDRLVAKLSQPCGFSILFAKIFMPNLFRKNAGGHEYTRIYFRGCKIFWKFTIKESSGLPGRTCGQG